jgi:hypothetical protein
MKFKCGYMQQSIINDICGKISLSTYRWRRRRKISHWKSRCRNLRSCHRRVENRRLQYLSSY